MTDPSEPAGSPTSNPDGSTHVRTPSDAPAAPPSATPTRPEARLGDGTTGRLLALLPRAFGRAVALYERTPPKPGQRPGVRIVAMRGGAPVAIMDLRGAELAALRAALGEP